MAISQVILLLCSVLASGGAVQISGGSGAAARIQAAVDACPLEGCTIQFPDASYPMENQVWIRNRRNIEFAGTGTKAPIFRFEDSLMVPDTAGVARLFRSTPVPGGGRPVLASGWHEWPLPSGSTQGTWDSLSPYASMGYQYNGMFVVDSSVGIGFERMVLDGNKLAMFYDMGVWSGRYSLLFGSVGISLLRSLAASVRNCEFHDFWSAFYINDRNIRCAAIPAAEFPDIRPELSWTACGTMGAHLIERNRIHANWWGIFSESEWDQGSVIRENIAWNNANQIARDSSQVVKPHGNYATTDEYLPGGFLFVKDVLFPAYVLSHNTLVDNPIPYAHAGYRATGNALWSDDMVDIQPTDDASWNHLFKVVLSPHLFDVTVGHHASGSFWAGASVIVTDSTFRTTGYRLVKKDSMAGTIDGGRVFQTPTDTMDTTLANGQTNKIIHYYTYTILYDTIRDTLNCARGCSLPMLNNDILVRGWSPLPWTIQAVPGGWWNALVTDLGGPRYYRTWVPSMMDSTGTFYMAYMDSAESRKRGNLHCRNCRFQSQRASDSLFLTPAWADSSGSLGFRNGSVGQARGAFGFDNRIGSQTPVRIRATGMPTYDDVAKEILLPISWYSEGPRIDKLVVRRIRGVGRPLSIRGTVLYMTREVNQTLGAVPDVLPGDTVVHVAFTPTANDSLFQFDVWLAGVSGSDTIPATPMSWTWSKSAGGHSFTVGLRRRGSASGTLRIRRAGGVWRANWPSSSGSEIELQDPRGRTIRFEGRLQGGVREADLVGLPRGIWLPLWQGAKPIAVF